MRVKVGDVWHEAQLGVPIMVEMEEIDRHHVDNMPGK